jgi:hypothetical protein
MADDLGRGDEATRRQTLLNLRHSSPALDEALPLLRQASGDPSEQVRSLACDALLDLGGGLSPERARRLERGPTDLAVHTLLLGYYFVDRFRSAAAARARHGLILRVIAEAPGSPVSGRPEAGLFPRDGRPYERARRLWLRQVAAHPDDARVLANAASFFLLSERPTGLALLVRARSLEPGNPEWARRLAEYLSLSETT